MSKRANGEGTIYKRDDGRWTARMSLPDGKRKDFYGRTRDEVRRKLAVAQKASLDGLPLPSERQTVASYLREWLVAIRPSLRPEAYRRYEEIVRIYLIPQLGRTPLARLSPQQVQRVYTQCIEQGLSPTTVRMVHGVLHKALAQAVRWGITVRNVSDLVDAPKRAEPHVRALSPDEAARFLAAVQGDRLEAIYVLAAACGLRLGELQALRWRDVDLPNHRLRVVATLQGSKGGVPVFAEPKSAKSKREIQLPEMVTNAIQRHRLAQNEERLRAGSEWDHHDLVFCNVKGRPLDANNLRQRSFARLLAKAGLPKMRFHDLRHTAATLLMSEGVPVKIVSEMLGHADVGITLRIYSHVLPGMQQQAADAMDKLFA